MNKKEFQEYGKRFVAKTEGVISDTVKDYDRALTQLKEAEKKGQRISVDFLRNTIPIIEGDWELKIRSHLTQGGFAMIIIEFIDYVYTDPYDGCNQDSFAWAQCKIVENKS